MLGRDFKLFSPPSLAVRGPDELKLRFTNLVLLDSISYSAKESLTTTKNLRDKFLLQNLLDKFG